MGRYEDEVKEGRAIDTRAIRRHGPHRNRPYILVVVTGGIADLATGNSAVDVDILDLDNLKESKPGQMFLSDREWAFVKANYPEEYKRLALATLTPRENKAWEHYFREAKDRGYSDNRADAFAWKQMTTDPDFDRLRYYHGAKP